MEVCGVSFEFDNYKSISRVYSVPIKTTWGGPTNDHNFYHFLYQLAIEIKHLISK